MLKQNFARYLRLISGLYLFGAGIAFMVVAGIGISPWDVLGQGLSKQLHLSFGVATLIISFIVLLGWIPIKKRPMIGTLANAVLIGLFADTVFPLVPKTSVYPLQLLEFAIGMVILSAATGLYISANLGQGPRDGLMLGTAQKLGMAIWKVRTGYELLVMSVGWLMGGQVREGTLIFALFIGILMQTSLKLFKIQQHRPIEEN